MPKHRQNIKRTLKVFTLLSLSLSSLSSLSSCASSDRAKIARDEMGQSQNEPALEEVDELQALVPSRSAAKKLNRELAPPEGEPVVLDGEKVDKPIVHQTEDYSRIYENDFLETLKNPLSTFSIDVDTASYSNARRFIEKQNQLPSQQQCRAAFRCGFSFA